MLTAGCVTCSRSAAAVKPPDSTTSQKASICAKFVARRPPSSAVAYTDASYF
jgi:hypothetical protein